MQEPLAEHIDGEVYSAAEPDELKDAATGIAHSYNSDPVRVADVMRIAARHMKVPFDEVRLCSTCHRDTAHRHRTFTPSQSV